MTLEEFLSLIKDEEARIELEIYDGFDEHIYHHFWLSDYRTNADIGKPYRNHNIDGFNFVPEKEWDANVKIYIKL